MQRPACTETEKALIGTLLRFPDDMDDAMSLNETDFDNGKYRKCFEVLKEFYYKTDDTIDWSQYAIRVGMSTSDIVGLVNDAISGTQIPGMVKKLKDMSRRRAIIEAGILMKEKAEDYSLDVDDLLSQAGAYIDGAAVSETKEPVQLITIVEGIIDNYMTGRSTKGIQSGLRDLDELWSGLYPGELTILGGVPSMGKTAYASYIALEVATKINLPVLFVSLEMPEEQLGLRYVATELNVDVDRLRREMVSKQFLEERQTGILTKFAGSNIYIQDEPDLTTWDILGMARKLQRKKGLGLLVVDYLNLLTDKKMKDDTRAALFEDMTRRLRAIGKKLKIPVVVLAQLNREVGKRENKRPVMSDLKESGGVEASADNILFFYRENYYKPEIKDNTLEIIIAKQKQGPRGVTAYVLYEPQTGTFRDKARQDEPQQWQERKDLR